MSILSTLFDSWMLGGALLQSDATGTERKLQFLDLPPAWVVGLVIVPLVLGLSFSLYRREGSGTPFGLRMFLASLRSLAILFLFFVYFRPVCVTVTYDEFKPVAAVLVDDSASMQRKEDYGDSEVGEELADRAGLASPASLADMTRHEVLQRVFEGTDFLAKLEEKHDVHVVAFDEDVRKLDGVEGLSGGGQYTKIGDALRSTLGEYRLQEEGWSVILVSDGRNNAGKDPMDIARAAALEDVKIYTVGVGDPAERNDVAIRDVKAPDVALIGDFVAFEVTVWSRGYEEQPASLQLTDKETGQVLEQADFVLRGRSQEQRESLYFRPDRDGEYTITVSIPVLPGELSEKNNSRDHHLRVDPELIKVMYVEGYPRWEYRYLKNTLLRAENMEAQCLLLSASKDFIQESTAGIPALISFPDRKSLFEYDVVILGDVNPYQLSDRAEQAEEILKNLKDFVMLGGGLLMVAGEIDNPVSFLSTELEDLLPVEIGERTEEQANVADRNPFRPMLENPFDPHDVVRLEKDLALNRQLWEDPDVGLSPLWWYFPVKRAKPGAEVLLRHPINGNRYGKHVLGATTFYPSGRTMFIAIDNTWRWRKPYGDRYTERFWRGTIRYLALNKLKRLDKRFEVTTDKALYDINERIVVRARIRDEDFRPATDEEQIVRYQPPDSDVQDLVLRKIEDGSYERSLHAAQPGVYQVWAEDEASGNTDKLSLVNFTVQIPRRELENDELDEATLTQLATTTGGEYRRLDRIDELHGLLKGEVIKKESGKEEEDVWDSMEWLLVLMALLGAEWGLRKRFNLI